MTILIAHNYSDFSYAATSKALAKRLASDGHKVIFFSHTAPDEINPTQGIEVLRWPEKRPTGFRSFKAIYKAIKTHKPTAILAHAAALNMVGLAGFLLQVPLRLAYYHSAYEATIIDNNAHAFTRLFQRIRKRFFYQCYHRVICVSQFAAKDLHQWFHFPMARTIVIPNALADRIGSDKIPDKPLPPPLTFFAASRLDTAKNIPSMVAGFLAFEANWTGQAKLIIAGDGPYADQLKQIAANNTCIEMVGQVAYHQIDRYMQQAHAIVCSTLAEAFGMVNIEAMMNATPVIASKVGGVPEIVKDGINGWLVDGHTPLHWQQAFEKCYAIYHSEPNTYHAMQIHGREMFLAQYQQNKQLEKLMHLLLSA